MTRYVCSQCGHEVLTEDAAPQKFCASCGEAAFPVKWQQNKQRDRLIQLIGGEISKIDAKSFASEALADKDPVPDMPVRVKKSGALIKMWLGRDGVTYLKNVDQGEMDAVLDGLLEKAPAQAFVFWQFKPWYYRFATRALDALLAIA